MSHTKWRSDGHCAAYGRGTADDNAQMALWRSRLHNEHTGMPRTDASGTNASVSLLWNPVSKASNQYQLASHKRVSNLKLVQDFGASPRGYAADAPPQQPYTRVRQPSPRTEGQLEAPPRRTFLDGESARLQASAHARNIGQTFLRTGNLAMAKAYLQRAETILQVPNYDEKDAARVLDEFKSTQRDPFS